ncbi:MAG: ABC transporter ATP-binding protein [Nitrospirota bacterium]|nr:ABC transporter ATP-binding protein [Nitrospirota bacterium]
MMDRLALSTRGLSKQYLLYQRGRHRLLEFFGIRLGNRGRMVTEHRALHDVSFDVERGSTVGIIGRNGAGKSTLLRLLAGTIAPSAGQVERHAPVSALLELGTGFHPDLTGHENIYASGLYLGLDKPAMDRVYGDVVAFAELGEFLHQPVRTYSTGMYMRLAFSLATCIPAEIQIIDEVLGVGDLYFFRKCLQRFAQLKEQGRTTILVSHDLGTVLRLCSRCLWLDRGRIVKDGTPLEVVTAYLESVYEDYDRQAWPSADADSADSGALRASRAVRVERVEFLDAAGLSCRTFSTGDPLTVRITYDSRVALAHPVVSVGIYRADGVLVCNAISSLDGANLELFAGPGSIRLLFDRLMLGPGEYGVAVAIYPSLDLGDSASPQHAALWHRPHTFTVSRPLDVAVDLGVFRHPARWHAERGAAMEVKT